ncbi:MAG: EAL domain-containing protein, partial [Acidimicrobiales bacterium]
FEKALIAREIRLVYQPVVTIDGAQIVGAEALVRWTHRDLGPISPATILDLAELTGLIGQLNHWIFSQAANDAATWPKSAHGDRFIAVNVTPSELNLPELASHVRDALVSSGIEAKNLVIELSERIVAPTKGFTENLDRLSELGVRLALDDFGEGRTSLAHLRGLPIDILKTDQLLAQHSTRSAPDRIILESVCRLAHELGMTVVAEGVEDRNQLEAVAAARADFVHGYLFYKPMDHGELLALLFQAAPSFAEAKVS